MVKLYILGLALVRFIGEQIAPLVGSELKEQVKLKKGDLFVTTKATAVALCGGVNYEWVSDVTELTEFLNSSVAGDSKTKCDCVIANSEAELYAILEDVDNAVTIILNYQDNQGGLTLSQEQAKLVKYINLFPPVSENADLNADDGIAGDGAGDSEVTESNPSTEETKKIFTKANILEATDEELKALCKEHKIKYGKLKRNDMVALLLPFLPEE